MSKYDLLRREFEVAGHTFTLNGDIGKILLALESRGIVLGEDNGRLQLMQNGQIIANSAMMVRMRQEFDSEFVPDPSRITRRSQLETVKQKTDYISQLGLERFAALPK